MPFALIIYNVQKLQYIVVIDQNFTARYLHSISEPWVKMDNINSATTVPVATSAKECFVGPSQDEIEKDKPSWGSSKTISTMHMQYNDTKKRKFDTDNRSTTSPTISTSHDTFSHAVGTFLSSGCCCIENVLPSQFVKD